MNSNNDVLNAKSSHLFAWSFKFDGDEAFCLPKTSGDLLRTGWKRKLFAATKETDSAQAATNFMLHQYLSASARDIFIAEPWPEKNEICRVYTYPHPLKDYDYLIETSGAQIFRLPIVDVELHVYNHGVGVLWLQLANDQYTDLADIKLINDLGRRISLPFVPCPYEKDDVVHRGDMLCAEKLGIAAKDSKQMSYVTDYRALCNALPQVPQQMQTLQNHAQFLTELLHCRIGVPEGAQALVTTDFKVRSFADDRMFTFCVIRDKVLSARLKTMDLQKNKMLLDELYQIAYVDPNSSSCPNAAMQKELLERALYPRWSAWGTVHLVTNYSMICITTDDACVNQNVVKPFLVEYSYCISLVLAQRIGISEFSVKAGAVVKGVEQKGFIKSKKVKALIHLQERYITFKNQLLILKFTGQEQGIELYDLLQKQLLIHKEQAVLDEQLESLYEVTNVSNSNKLNNLALWFAIAAILVDVGINIACTWGEDILRFLFAL